MRDRPAGFGDQEVRAVLADGWQIDAVTVSYAPIGGGSYHWIVHDMAGGRWFATADDLGDKAWLGETAERVFDGLRTALDTAITLRDVAGLGFVAAPVRSAGGAPIWPIGPGHALSVFSFIDGISGEFEQGLSGAQRTDLAYLLATLHNATPVVAAAPARPVTLAWRGHLETALADLGRPWTSGPFAEPARALLTAKEGPVRRALRVFDGLAARVAAEGRELVVTHGEPHPGNLIWVRGQMMLVDWDTVGLAVPERDLWWIGDDDSALVTYASVTGRAPSAAALALYRLRWQLDDISSFVSSLRSSHGQTADAERALQCLDIAMSLGEAAVERGVMPDRA